MALSFAISHASDWLNVLSQSIDPISRTGSFMSPVLVGAWLRKGPYVAFVSQWPILFVIIRLAVGGTGDIIYRHDSIWDAVYVEAQSAALVLGRKVPALEPAEVFLPNWKRGLYTCCPGCHHHIYPPAKKTNCIHYHRDLHNQIPTDVGQWHA